MSKAVVIIPTYNERENIASVIPILQDVFAQTKKWDLHILVVDDSSPDKTAEVVKTLAKKHANVHLLMNAKKAGLGAAYMKGMDEAFYKLKADVVFEFDADLSHDPQKIPVFLEKIDAGYDMVLGSRYIPGGGIPDNWDFHRKFLSVVGNIIVMSVLMNFSLHDWTGGYRAITKQVYEAIEPEMHDPRFTGYTFQIAFLHKAVMKGFKIVEIPFKFVDRTIGVSKLPKEYISNNLSYLFKARFQEIVNHRIFKFVMVGGLGALVQFMALAIFRNFLPFQLAFFLGIECAVVSNFALNNLWTFADRKLPAAQIPLKFVQFNIASSGSIIIQQAIAFLGELAFGTTLVLFTIPFIHLAIDLGTIYAVVGILAGMFWNFFAYNAFIWKKKPR